MSSGVRQEFGVMRRAAGGGLAVEGRGVAMRTAWHAQQREQRERSRELAEVVGARSASIVDLHEAVLASDELIGRQRYDTIFSVQASGRDVLRDAGAHGRAAAEEGAADADVSASDRVWQLWRSMWSSTSSAASRLLNTVDGVEHAILNRVL